MKLLYIIVSLVCVLSFIRAEIIPTPHKILYGYSQIPAIDSVQLKGFEHFKDAHRTLVDELSYHGIEQQKDGYPIAITRQKDLKQEEYSIKLSETGGRLIVADAIGARNAVSTLKKIMHPSHGKLHFRSIEILDRPTLAIRGILLNLKSEIANDVTMRQLKKLFVALSDLKYNTVFIELGGNLEFESRSFPRCKKPFSKSQIKDLITCAERCGLEIIPYFQTMSHCSWILGNPDNISLLEDPTNISFNTTWCPENPKTEEFFLDILKETIELFEPRYVHLGFDEIGPFAQCPRCRHIPREKLLANEIKTFYNYLKSQGVQTIIWHDELLEYNPEARRSSSARAWQARNLLPRDIIIAIWYYKPDPASMERLVNLFTSLGYKWLGAGWNSIEGIHQLCSLCASSPSNLGMLCTVWHHMGRWGKPDIPRSGAIGYVVATAESSWNPKTDVMLREGFDPVSPLMREWFRGDMAPSRFFYKAVSLHQSSELLPSELFGGICEMYDFRLGSRDPIICLHSNERRVDVTIEAKARALAFIHYAISPTEIGNNEVIGHYILHLSNGNKLTIPLRYGWNIVSPESVFPALLNQEMIKIYKKSESSSLKSTLYWHLLDELCHIHAISVVRSPSYNGEITLLGISGGITKSSKQKRKLLVDESFDYRHISEMQKKWFIKMPAGIEWRKLKEGICFKTHTIPNERLVISKDITTLQPSLSHGGGELEFYSSYSEPILLGIYLGDKDWKRYVCMYRHIKPGHNGIYFNFSDMKPESGGHGNAFEKQFSQFQLGLWLPSKTRGDLDIKSLKLFSRPMRICDWYEMN